MPTLIRHRQPAITNKFTHANNRKYLKGLNKQVLPAFAAVTPGRELTLEPTIGKGGATFTRASVATVRDFENNFVKVFSGEPRFQGARRACNLLWHSNDLSENPLTGNQDGWLKSNITLTENVAGPRYTNEAWTMTADANGAYIRQDIDLDFLDGYGAYNTGGVGSYRASFWARRRTGSGVVDILPPGLGGAYEVVPLTNEWQRFTFSITASRAGDNFIGIILRMATSGDQIDVFGFQMEDVSGQSNQAPSEYIHTDNNATGSKNYRYFASTNGNSVASNVVTHRSGEPLHPVNTRFGPRRFARFNKWQATTAYQVGDKIIPATGSGPGGGNGYYYECMVAGTTGASEPTWETQPGFDAAYNSKFENWSGGLPDGFAQLGTASAVAFSERSKLGTGGMRLYSDGTYIGVIDSANANIVVGRRYVLEIKIKKITGQIRAGYDTNQFGTFDAPGLYFRQAIAAPAAQFNIARNAACDAHIEYYRLWEETRDGASFVCKGQNTLAGYQAEPSRENKVTYSYDLTQWTQFGTAVTALDAAGLQGVSNTATTITDDSAAGYEYVQFITAIANDNASHCAQVFVKKQAVQSYPLIWLRLNGGTAQSKGCSLNTATGTWTAIAGAGAGDIWVQDGGDWWIVNLVSTNNTTGNVNAELHIYPAYSTTEGGGGQIAETGAVVVAHAQIELNTTRPTSPIITNGATATRQPDVLSYTGDLLLYETRGSCLISWAALFDSPTTFTLSLLERMHYFQNKNAIMYDGSSSQALSNGYNDFVKESLVFKKGGSYWDADLAEMKPAVNGTAGAGGTFDGDLDNVNTRVVVNASDNPPVFLTDILFYDFPLTTEQLEDLTGYDQ